MKDSVRRPANAGVDSADAKLSKSGRRRAFIRKNGIPTLIGLILVSVITAAMMTYSDHFLKDHLIFIYLLPITGVAMYFSSTPALVTSIVSVLVTAYFLFPPTFSFFVAERLQVAELIVFSLFAFIASKASSELSR